MRIAGVRLLSGSMRWVQAGNHHLAPMDRVKVRCESQILAAVVYVTPEQLLRSPVDVTGSIEEVLPREAAGKGCCALPGADLPPLGSLVRIGGVEGTVTGLDPAQRRLTVTTPAGLDTHLPFEDLPGQRRSTGQSTGR